MEEFTIELTDATARDLRAKCAELGVRPEDLLRIHAEEILREPSEEFRALAEYVLTKNLELYKRVA